MLDLWCILQTYLTFWSFSMVILTLVTLSPAMDIVESTSCESVVAHVFVSALTSAFPTIAIITTNLVSPGILGKDPVSFQT